MEMDLILSGKVIGTFSGKDFSSLSSLEKGKEQKLYHHVVYLGFHLGKQYALVCKLYTQLH